MDKRIEEAAHQHANIMGAHTPVEWEANVDHFLAGARFALELAISETRSDGMASCDPAHNQAALDMKADLRIRIKELLK